MESQLRNFSEISAQPRWDFRYFEPKYLSALEELKNGKYPLEPLGNHTKEVQNFGAYSLCNLLEWVDEGVPYVRVTDMKEDGINWDNVPKIPLRVHELLPKSKVYPEDVIYSMAGTIGLALVAPKDLKECNSNQATAKIRINSGKLNPYYLAAFLNSRLGKYQSERIANGQTVLNINLGEIENLLIPIPPPEIQTKIATIILGSYKEKKRRLIEALSLEDATDKWVLDYCGIELSDLKPKNHFLSGIENLQSNKRWDVPYFQVTSERFIDNPHWAPLSEFAEVKRSSSSIFEEHEEFVYYVDIQTMRNNSYWSTNNARMTDVNDLLGACQQMKGGDVLLSRLGPSLANKKIVLVPDDIEKGYCSPEFIVLTPKEGVDKKFLLWSVKANFIIEQLLYKTRGATPSRARLDANDLMQTFIPNVDSDQQKVIGAEYERRWLEIEEFRKSAIDLISKAKYDAEPLILGKEV